MVYPNPSNGLFFLDISMENPEELRISLVSHQRAGGIEPSSLQRRNHCAIRLISQDIRRESTRSLITGDSMLYKAKVIIY